MRPSLLLPAALLALAGTALAAGVCAPTCEVVTAQLAFVPAATMADSGATIRWSAPSLDVPHTASADDLCFHGAFNPGGSASATFRIAEGRLWARSGTQERACADATALPDGSFRLPYRCLYHRGMVGELVIAPEVTL